MLASVAGKGLPLQEPHTTPHHNKHISLHKIWLLVSNHYHQDLTQKKLLDNVDSTCFYMSKKEDPNPVHYYSAHTDSRYKQS